MSACCSKAPECNCGAPALAELDPEGVAELQAAVNRLRATRGIGKIETLAEIRRLALAAGVNIQIVEEPAQPDFATMLHDMNYRNIKVQNPPRNRAERRARSRKHRRGTR